MTGPLAIQAYLRLEGKRDRDASPLVKLQDDFAVRSRRHGEFPNLVSFKYTIDSPLSERIVQECRGLILNQDDDWSVVARGYDKFFNYGDPSAAEIDWQSARVYEKLDGTLCLLYWYEGEWRVATTGRADACGEVYDSEQTFAELFWKTWNNLGYRLPRPDGYLRSFTFLFELMSLDNRIVVRHERPHICLHGARHTASGREVNPEAEFNLDLTSAYGWAMVKPECVPRHGLCEQVMEAAHNLDPMQQEGFVVCDKNFNRVKIKSPAYVRLHRLISGFSGRRAIDLIRRGEDEAFLLDFPELGALVAQVRHGFNVFVTNVESLFVLHREIDDQKEFAMAVKAHPCAGILFALRNGKTASVREYLSRAPIRQVEALLGFAS